MSSLPVHGNSMTIKTYEPLTLMDFSDPDCILDWQPINDGVMGGQSQSVPQIVDGSLVFTGTISLANNGGFASIRARQQHHDLSGYDSVLLRVKGDGRTYQLRLYTDACYQGKRIAYATPFQTTNDSWVELRLHFSQLQATFRGQKLSGPAFDPASIAELGFMLVDKRAGAFQLQVAWVKAI